MTGVQTCALPISGRLPGMADSTEADVVGEGGDLLAYDLKELRWEMLPITRHRRRIGIESERRE